MLVKDAFFIIYIITQQKKKDLVEVVNIFPDILKVSYSVHFSSWFLLELPSSLIIQ